MENIILCGFMGCGKTTVGENLKKKSGMNLIDTDAYIEETEGMTISKIFEKYGESFMDFPLKGLKFKKTAWTKKNNHTHCLFCGDEITNEEYNYHTEKQGYASTTKFWWSCPECFEVFTQKYNLPVVKNTVKDIELALSQFKTVVISLENKQYFIKNTDGKITVEHNGVRKSYDSILSMEREQLFYGKVLREIIDDIFVGFVD